MSEMVEAPAGEPGAPAQNSAGAMLRQAREAQGLHIETLAVSLKVPVSKLEALEADHYDLLLDSVFVRALAASVCRSLKIDPLPIMERLPATTLPRLKTDEAGINTPFRLAGEGAGHAISEQLSKPLVLAILVLLVGVLVLAFFPFEQAVKATNASVPASETQSPVTRAATATQPAEPATTEATTPAQLSSLALASSDAPLAISPAVPASAAVTPSTNASAASAPGLLVFQANASSWLEVVDAGRIVRVRKILNAGEVISVSGQLPVSVVVGSADALQVQVRGQALDLKPLAKNNVARFEVK